MEPLCVDVGSGQVNIRQLQQMRGFAAGCSAGIEHAHAVSDIEQFGRHLRAGILHRDLAIGKSRQQGNRPRLFDDDTLPAHDMRGDILQLQHFEVIVAGDLSAVHAQCQRRAGVAGIENFTPGLGVFGGDTVDPPLRIGIAAEIRRHDRSVKFVAAAQKIAQHRVDQALGFWKAQLGGRGNRVIDDRI